MTFQPYLIRKINQISSHDFSIEWSDGAIQNFRLSELQKKCPCANCVDETTGKRILNESVVEDDVRASRILSVGRYALRIEFTSGCRTGIYGFDFLRQISTSDVS